MKTKESRTEEVVMVDQVRLAENSTMEDLMKEMNSGGPSNEKWAIHPKYTWLLMSDHGKVMQLVERGVETPPAFLIFKEGEPPLLEFCEKKSREQKAGFN